MKLGMQREQRRAATEKLEKMQGELPLLHRENQAAKSKTLGKLTVYFIVKLYDFW